MRDRREPVFREPNEPGPAYGSARPAEVHVHIHHETAPTLSSEKRLVIWLVGAIVSALAVLAAVRWYQLKVIQTAMNQVTRTATAMTEQAQRAATVAQEQARQQAQAAQERIDREKAERAAAQRRAIETENARIASAQAQEVRRERAWQKFYVPSEFCKNPDSRATMECANAYARAKKEFDRRWAAGEL